MPRLFLKFSLLVTLMLTITSLTAHALGSTQPLNPALRGFTEGCEGKSQPCWYGIVIGETLIDDAIDTLNQRGYSTAIDENIFPKFIEQVWYAKPSDKTQCQITLVTSMPNWTDETYTKTVRYVETLILEDCPHLRLGDLFSVFKTPQIAYYPSNCRAIGITFEYMSLNDWRVNSSSNLPPTPFVPQDSIDTINIHFLGDLNIKFDDSWQGFAFPWKLSRALWNKYCRYG